MLVRKKNVKLLSKPVEWECAHASFVVPGGADISVRDGAKF